MIDCHSLRHSAAVDTRSRAPQQGSRIPDDVLLDAARTCIIEHGPRAATLTGIARTAGVSRMTIYRRFPDVGTALTALLTRDFRTLLAEITAAGHSGHARDRLVHATLDAIRALTEHPLLRTVLTTDAASLLPYVTDRLGATQREAESFIAEFVAAGHADGSIRKSGNAAQARTVLLIAQSFTLSLRPATADITTT